MTNLLCRSARGGQVWDGKIDDVIQRLDKQDKKIEDLRTEVDARLKKLERRK